MRVIAVLGSPHVSGYRISHKTLKTRRFDSSYLFTLLDDVDDLRDVVVGAELRRANVHVDVVLAGTALAPLREEVVRQTLHERDNFCIYDFYLSTLLLPP